MRKVLPAAVLLISCWLMIVSARHAPIRKSRSQFTTPFPHAYVAFTRRCSFAKTGAGIAMAKVRWIRFSGSKPNIRYRSLPVSVR